MSDTATMSGTSQDDAVATSEAEQAYHGNGNFFRRPYVRPTNADIQDRIECCMEWQLEGWKKSDIVKEGKTRWACSTRTIETYLSRARGQMIELADNKPKQERRLQALSVYAEIVANKRERTIDRIKAQERIDKLFGLEIHDARRLEISGPGGAPIKSESLNVTLDLTGKLGEYTDAVRRAALANVLEQAGQIGTAKAIADAVVPEVAVGGMPIKQVEPCKPGSP